MPRRSTIHALALAWAAVAAIVAIAWLLTPESELPPGQVHARYERQGAGRRAPPRSDLKPGATTAAVDSTEVAEVESQDAAEVAWVSSWLAARPTGTGRVFGTVTARETGAPVAGVIVNVYTEEYRWWPQTSGVTGADGGYDLRGLPAREVFVSVRSDEADVADEPPRAAHLKPGEERRVDLTVERAGRVWGTVTDGGGRPVPNARLIVGTTDSIVSQAATLATRRKDPPHGRSDERGAYVIRGVPFEQEWQVWVDHDGHAPVLSPSFVLHAARPEVRVDVTLLTGSRISGRVVEPSGRPVRGAEVLCVPRYAALLMPMRRAYTARKDHTDALGRFALEALPAGDFQVLAFEDGYRLALQGEPVYPDGRNDIEGVELTLRPILDGDHQVFGVVVDSGGAPVVSASVGLGVVGMDTLSFGGKQTTTGEDGSFRFQGVGGGGLVLAAHKEGFRQRIVERVPVDRRMSVSLEREASVSGVVRLPDGSPAQAFRVRVVRRVGTDDGSAPSFVDAMEALGSEHAVQHAEGRFTLRVPPGRVLLEASADGHAPGRVEVEVPRGQAVTGVDLRLPASGGVVRGQVTTRDGAPVQGATVTVVELGPGASGLARLAEAERGRGRPTAITDLRGTFTIEGLAAATYLVEAHHARHAPARLRPVVVGAGQAQDVRLVLTAGGTIVARAAPGVMITVAGDGYSSMVAAGDDGSCRFERVPAGTYLVRAVVSEVRFTTAPAVHRRSVRVEEGAAASVTFVEEAPQARTVEGRTQEAPPEGALALVLLRVPGSPEPDPADLVFQGALGVSDPETGRYVVAEALARKDGGYALHDVPPGRYTLDVWVTTLVGTLTGTPATLQERKEIAVD